MTASRVANSKSFQVSTPSDREIRMTRLFDAPADLGVDAVAPVDDQRLGQLGDARAAGRARRGGVDAHRPAALARARGRSDAATADAHGDRRVFLWPRGGGDALLGLGHSS